MGTVPPGFKGRGRRRKPSAELPPGQYLVEDFPVLSAGPTPDIEPKDWGDAGPIHETTLRRELP
jgi:hypothetical protein